jgi:hypothetical protein
MNVLGGLDLIMHFSSTDELRSAAFFPSKSANVGLSVLSGIEMNIIEKIEINWKSLP